MTASRRFGDTWFDQSRTAVLIVPSLVTRIDRNILLNARHRDFARQDDRVAAADFQIRIQRLFRARRAAVVDVAALHLVLQPVTDQFEHALFGFFHPAVGVSRATGVVLCPPVGADLVRAHRALRHLAERLARAGFDVLRFDFR